MPKESFEQFKIGEQAKKEQGPKKPEPIFATPEELKEKEKLFVELQEFQKDDSLQGLQRQKEIKLQLLELDQRRIQRIAKEKGEAMETDLTERIKLHEQYQSQKDILKELGIVKKLRSGELGIVGLDNKEYPLPEYQDILQRMEKQKETIKTKQEQGFTKLLLVPFGMKLGDLIEKYKEIILKHHKQGKLLATKKDPKEPDEKLELDQNEPVWAWEQYKEADTKGELVYFPKEFSKNPQGKTKKELIKEQGAWNVLLIEDLPNIPREDKGKTIKNRKQLEANQTPNEYLKTLQQDKQYKAEQGMTPEDQLFYAILYLEQTNQVIDDYQGNGSLSFQLGAYFLASGDVPLSYWYRGVRQAFLGGYVPGYRSDVCGARLGVRLAP